MSLAITAGVVAVGTVASAAVSYNAAKDAAGAQQTAANTAAQEQADALTSVTNMWQPYMNTGKGANNILDSLYGIDPTTGKATGKSDNNYAPFYSSPGYNFQKTQGENAINRQASANGNLYSTNTLTSQDQFAQGLAGTTYQQYLANIMGLAGLGTTATNAVSGATLSTATNRGSAAISAGNAQASGDLNEAGAINSGIKGLEGAAGAFSGASPAMLSTMLGGLNPNSSGVNPNAGSGYNTNIPSVPSATMPQATFSGLAIPS